jgi:replicative DNA helicase
VSAPTEIEAEAFILSTLFSQPTWLNNCDLEPDDFYHGPHRIIFSAMKGRVINRSEVISHLTKKNQMSKVGIDYIAKLSNMPSMALDDFESAMKLIADASLCRRYYDLADHIKEQSAIVDDPSLLADIIMERVRGINRLTQDESVLMWDQTFDFRNRETQRRIEQAKTGEVLKLDWPWRSWNNIIRPMREGTLGLIVGLSSLGKTLYGSSIAEHWAQKELKVVFFHYELDHSFMLDRQDAKYSGVPLENIEDGKLTDEDVDKLILARAQIADWGGAVHYVHSPGWPAGRVAGMIQKLHDLGECDAFVVDYLQKIPFPVNRSFNDLNAAQLRGKTMDIFKDTVEITRTSGVVFSQYNNKAKRIKSVYDLQDDMIRDGGEPNDKSNLTIYLYGEKLESDFVVEGEVVARQGDFSPLVSLLVGKQTRGPLGSFRQYLLRNKGRIFDLPPEGENAVFQDTDGRWT